MQINPVIETMRHFTPVRVCVLCKTSDARTQCGSPFCRACWEKPWTCETCGNLLGTPDRHARHVCDRCNDCDVVLTPADGDYCAACASIARCECGVRLEAGERERCQDCGGCDE